MEPLPAKTQIGEVECSGCGATIPLKVNVNQCVYYFCANVLARDENGKCTEKCMTRFNLGRKASQPMIEKYLNSQGEKPDVGKIQNREEPREPTKETNVERKGSNTEPDYAGENIIPDDEPETKSGFFDKFLNTESAFD